MPKITPHTIGRKIVVIADSFPAGFGDHEIKVEATITNIRQIGDRTVIRAEWFEEDEE